MDNYLPPDVPFVVTHHIIYADHPSRRFLCADNTEKRKQWLKHRVESITGKAYSGELTSCQSC